jgi:hypothetical protein
MTIGGWIFMLTSLTFVIGLAAWCFHRVFRPPQDSDDSDDCRPVGL